IASVPFHMWCPDVYEGAPTPFTAFLSVGPKAAGFAVAIRFFFAAFERQVPGGGYVAVTELPWPSIIGIISAITMTLGHLTALALTIFLFSLTGIPPFAGFAGKYLIFAAVVQRGGFWFVLLAVIGVLNSAVSLFYYARIIKAMFLEEALDDRPMSVPAVYTGV